MRHAITVGVLLSAIAVLPGQAGAETGLTSIPLVAAAGGVACSCLNLTDDSLDLDLLVGGTPHLLSLAPSSRTTVGSFSGGGSFPTSDCKVFRTDGGTLSTKHVACSFSSVDGDGNPTVVVPLDQKIQHP